MIDRETIYAALFAKAIGAAGFVTSNRRLRHIDEMQPGEFPAVFQTQDHEEWQQTSGNLPPVGTFFVEWWVYVQSGDESAPHASQLNPLVDALLGAVGLPPSFNPSPNGTQALGGLVESVRLDGRIDYAEGAMTDRAFARIPLLIKTTG